MEFLNRRGFWWLMGALILAVAVVVVSLEADERALKEDAVRQQPLATGGEPVADHAYGARDVVHLTFCVVGLNISLLLSGIAQEYVMTNVYEDSHGRGELMPSALFVVLCNRLCAVVFSGVILRVLDKPVLFPGFIAGILPAASNSLASWCQYRSLSYISFSLQVTAKSGKLLPVLLLASLRGKRYKLVDYAEVLVILSALVVFGFETDGRSQPFDTTAAGLLLMCGFILLDSCTPHFQDAIFERYRELDPLQVMLSMSSFASVALATVSVANGAFFSSVAFLSRHPEALLHIAVLSLSSTLTQYLISYTVKHFGPVVFTLISSTQRLVSVCMSTVLFQHETSTLAAVSAVLVYGTMAVRALRSLAAPARAPLQDASLPDAEARSATVASRLSTYRPLLVCALGIHVLYCFYAIVQEFLATHTFNGHLFTYPILTIAVNHSCGALFALVAIKFQGLPVFVPGTRLTLLPAASDFVSTYLQHQALYFMYFPAQTLMKTLKLIPVMLVGRLLKNRSYSSLDYVEGALITGLVSYFVWDFQLRQGSRRKGSTTSAELAGATMGIALMLGYVVSDSFLSNLEDYVYQATSLDPGQMLFGLELFSGAVGWIALLASGQLLPALRFLALHREAVLYIALQALASASGAYTCTLTVRRLGPAVFTLLMMSRQVLSLVFSVVAFKHAVEPVSCLCLVAVAILMLASCLRRVATQLAAGASDREGDGKAH